MATSSVNIVNTLGAGSGIDTKALAQSLVDAERAPRKDRIDGQIKKEEARITGHGAIKSLLTQLKDALAKVNDAKEFTSITPSNSQPAAFGATAGSNAAAGTYSVEVTQIAKPTRLATSTSFASTSTAINGGAPFDLWLTKPVGAVTEQHTVTFGALLSGQSVSAGGLTLNAAFDMTADEVAAAFSTPQTVSGAKYSLAGTLTGWTVGSASANQLSFTSTTASKDVTDLAVSVAGDGAAVPAPTMPAVGAAQGSGTQVITVNTATPAGIVQAINEQSKTTGVSAQLVNTGSGYALTFTGQSGAANAFTLRNLPGGVTMRPAALQEAQDAVFSVNGLSITSASNQVADVIPGVTLDLYAQTTAGTPARLDLNRQSSGLKDKFKEVVEAYNTLDDSLKVLGDSESKVEEFGGVLAGDSILNMVRSQARGLFTKINRIYPNGDNTQAALNPDVYAARHVGLSFDRQGKLTLDETKLDKALADHFDQVVTLFTANKNDQTVYAAADGSLAGDAVKSLDKMLRSTGFIDKQSQSASSKIAQYKKELTQLEERMDTLLKRYTAQFSVMDGIVGESNATRTNLTNSFKGLMAMYTNN